jgi:hypothetical protein
MAPRTVKIRHDDETRAKIKTSQLINRLQGHALSNTKLEASQIKAIEVLLRKALPDLSAVELSGNLSVNHEDALNELDGPREADQAKAKG